MYFINFFGDSIHYKKLSLGEFEKAGGDYIINTKRLSKYDFEYAIRIPYNKGYDEEKLIRVLIPEKLFSYHPKTKMWLIRK